jgi:hypothetical protein
MKRNIQYWIDGIFHKKWLKWLVPQRNIAETFKYKGKRYLTVYAPEDEKIGCCCKDHNGNTKSFCAFADRCGSVPILKRGFCYSELRKDNISVAFKEYITIDFVKIPK